MSRLGADGLGMPVSGAAPVAVYFTPSVVAWPGVTTTASAGYYIRTPGTPGMVDMWMTFTVSVSAAAQLTVNMPPGIVGFVPVGFAQVDCGFGINTSGVASAAAALPTTFAVLSWTPGVGVVYVFARFPVQ